MNILVTGCAGFIGSHFVDEALECKNSVIGVDILTYAGKLANMSSFQDKIHFHETDICDTKKILNITIVNDIEWIINFAAETHVDNSIDSCDEFIRTNIFGVKSLLEVCRETGCKLMQISTDEVYGSATEGSFVETDRLNPKNPYSATKAAAEHLVTSYSNTFGTKYRMVRMSNNFGPRQHHEKLIPTIISCIIQGNDIPIYGDGKNVRDWFYVKDCVRMIHTILEQGEDNNTYNLTHNNEFNNLEIVNKLCNIMGVNSSDKIKFVDDRPGHDRRYSINNEKSKKIGIGKPTDLIFALKDTVSFYMSGDHA